MTKRILADIDVILKRIGEAYPGIPELSRAEVAALKPIADKRVKVTLSRLQQDPSYKEDIDKKNDWKQHLKTVISVNEQAFEDEPAPAKKKRSSGNPSGRPRETDWEEEADIERQWRQAASHMSRAEFADEIGMPIADMKRLLSRVRERKSRQREA